MGQVPVKWNHKTGADAVNGYVTNFHIDGQNLRGEWHLLKTHSQFQQALELAERMPRNIGLSAAFVPPAVVGSDEDHELPGHQPVHQGRIEGQHEQ